MKQSERILLRLLFLLVSSCVAVGSGIWLVNKFSDWRETRRHEYLPDDIESRAVKTKLPVVVITGTVDGRKFELVTRGRTNYFRKETWGTPRGEKSFLFGQQEPGGYAIELRTRNFSGQWKESWRGSHAGGGGGGNEGYWGDMLPGRWLSSHTGFVGAAENYEFHRENRHEFPNNHQRIDEEYQQCRMVDGVLVPGKIIWSKYYGVNAQESLTERRVYKIESIRFQSEPSEDWFDAREKEYFSESTRRYKAYQAKTARTNQ